MSRIPRASRTLALSALLALVAAIVLGGTVAADQGSGRVLAAGLVGLPADMTNTTLFGVQAGGLPWRLTSGNVMLSSTGNLKVEVDGLVLAAGPNEGTNPIGSAQAIVTCAGVPVAMSGVVPYSPAGDAVIHAMVSLPSPCLAPAVFFAGVPAPGVDRWFAVSGQ